MTKFLLIVLLSTPILALGQRHLKPTIHLEPFKELDNATVTALTEDQLGQIWIGTQTGIRYWDGTHVNKIDSNTVTVTRMYSADSFVYVVQLNSILKINCWTLSSTRYDFPYSDYRRCNFRKNEILTISNDFKDTVILDYQLTRKPTVTKKLSTTDSCYVGNFQIRLELNPNRSIIVGSDSTPISNTYVGQVLKYNETTVFVAAHEGLIELSLTDNGQIERTTHLKSFRAEQLLLDRNKNVWVGTAENGLFMFHRNMILNRYYPQNMEDGTHTPCWTFARINGQLYNCTTNGLVAFGNKTDKPDVLEKATKGIVCFSALQTSRSVLIGTANAGLLKFDGKSLKRIYFNPNNNLDNTIIQIIEEPNSIVFCTKAGIHRMDESGKIVLSKDYADDVRGSYVMQMYPNDAIFLSANTDGLYKYDQSFRPIKKLTSPHARVFSDLAHFENTWWCTTMDGGVFKLNGDSLIPVSAPNHQLLVVSPFKKGLWFTGLSGAMHYENERFTSYTLENGFPLDECAQGGLFNDGDSMVHFAGVQGIFSCNGSLKKPESMPLWHIQLNGSFLPSSSESKLPYDQSIVNLLPRAIITSDRNWFDLDYRIKDDWLPVKNGAPLLVNLDYGLNKLEFRIRNKYTGTERIEEYQFHRVVPIWLKTWFRLVAFLAILGLLVGFYFLWKYLNTRKMLKMEAEERKVTQERLRISRELHDNIGARLSHIISSLDVQLYKEKGSDEIAVINSFAKETMRELRETIWAVGDKTIFFSELKQRIARYIDQTNSVSTPEITYTDDCPKTEFELNTTETINTFRIVQEGINNALKYSKATKITVRFKEVDHAVCVTIQDNGQGFPVTASEKMGSGLTGIKRRAEEMSGAVTIQSKTGEGSSIQLTIFKK
ncbi:MAG: sensor histidine kinase [Bacteroidia bacterium]|nr:sensor histidine kinase [Bacteroidia bacterium]